MLILLDTQIVLFECWVIVQLGVLSPETISSALRGSLALWPRHLQADFNPLSATGLELVTSFRNPVSFTKKH